MKKIGTRTKRIKEEVNVKKLNKNAIIPTKGTEDSAGWDMYACIDAPVSIEAHTTVKIPTGIAMELPQFTAGLIYSRSGMATKRSLVIAQGTAVIDADYRGEWMIPLHNDSNVTQYVEPNERIAQFIVTPYVPVTLVGAYYLSETKRGDGGFGSTGR